jgi:DME family drug/metabolite transporter
MQYSEHTRGLLAVLFAALIWSTGGMFIKLISYDAYTIAGLRSAFAAIVFLVIFRRTVFTINWLTLFNAAMYAAILTFFVIATKRTTAANAIFLQFTAPLYVLILEPLLLKTRLERINVLTIGVCFVGMSLFFIGKLDPGHLSGNLIALCSGICFAAFLLGQRKNAPQYHAAAIFWGNILIGLICLPALLQIPTIFSADFLMGTYLGIVQIGIAYAIFTYGLKRVHAVESALIAMVEPVLNPVWVFIGYGEQPSPGAITGGLLILVAIATRSILIERRRRQALAEGRPLPPQ